MERSVQLALFLLLSFPVLSLARGGSRSSSSVASICASTPSPRLCMIASASGGASNFPTANKAERVLRSNLRWIASQCTSAKKMARSLSRRARPNTAAALKECAQLYGSSMDQIGASEQGLNNLNKEQQNSKGPLVQMMLIQIKQSVEQCNQLFVKLGRPNPLAGYNTPLIKMTEVADSINNRMNTRSS